MGYILPAVSGILLALSFPKADLSFLAWAALAPLLVSLSGKPGRLAFKYGFASGMAFYTASIYWVINTMHNYGGLPYIVSIPLLVLLSAYMALYVGLFAWLFGAVRERSAGAAVFAAPALWASLELVRNYALSGFPWDLLGYSQHSNLTVIQVADISGVYGVSALIVLINAALAYIISMRMTGEAVSLKRLSYPVAAALILAAVLGYGRYRLAKAAYTPDSGGKGYKVSLVQGNIEQFHKWDPEYQDEVIEAYRSLTLEAANSRPDVIIWPETATPFYFQDMPRRLELQETVRKAGTFLLTGSPAYESVGEPAEDKFLDFNSAYLMSADGEVAGRYNKMHLVPFGEYVPMKTLLPFVSKMVTSIGDFGRGTEYTVLEAGRGRFGTAICFEVIFPELVRRFADNGANFLVSITNDAWFADSAAPYQHFNMSVFRAVENRRAMVRAANTGITGIILPTGEVAARTVIFTRTALTAEIPLVTEKTFYTRYGDVFAYLCVLLSAGFLITTFPRRRESRKL
ncbi:MAG: apolipoprotein N-acyltransferase [Nitrospirae bacterium]|nr:apolipoprotein N-acyltransferase [Nitrospirota bacterium]